MIDSTLVSLEYSTLVGFECIWFEIPKLGFCLNNRFGGSRGAYTLKSVAGLLLQGICQLLLVVVLSHTADVSTANVQ